VFLEGPKVNTKSINCESFSKNINVIPTYLFKITIYFLKKQFIYLKR
jgi:hypothetical protein